MEQTLMVKTDKKSGKLDAYTDKYFLRSKKILQEEGLNPYVRAQVFVRKGPGIVKGLDEAIDLIKENSPLAKHGGKIYALKDGDSYESGETQMIIEGRIDDFIELETTYLGVLAAGITQENTAYQLNAKEITEKTRRIVSKLGGRPLSYFGARHHHYQNDALIAKAAFDGGATSASTDIGAATVGKSGIGTIPHALENIYAFVAGKDDAVKNATLAFDRHIDPAIPRVALIDYNNKEIDDSIATADALEGRLSAVRVDTCGENFAQGSIAEYKHHLLEEMVGKELTIKPEHAQYWVGTGVTVSGVYALRKGLDAAGHENVGIFLTSGFGDETKVDAFIEAEKQLGMQLFTGIGVGGLYKSLAATMDIVAVGADEHSLEPMSKVGRTYKPNERLERRL
ncbi:MAG: nicotinate phosphoribosyltransferase [Nanoarchaeota archaeon]|nr:nicotinate phosphoribosyltransferase [Nanoarchaeota archaeon]